METATNIRTCSIFSNLFVVNSFIARQVRINRRLSRRFRILRVAVHVHNAMLSEIIVREKLKVRTILFVSGVKNTRYIEDKKQQLSK